MILRSFARDFRDFWGVFWLEIFVIFALKSRDFQEKSSANTAVTYDFRVDVVGNFKRIEKFLLLNRFLDTYQAITLR